MIEQFRIQNYKALRDVTCNLTPIHAFIGPNDSGKTSILSAILALSRSTDHPLSQAFAGRWNGRELVSHGDPDGVARLSAVLDWDGEELRYTLASRFPNSGRDVRVEDEKIYQPEEIDCASQNHRASKVYGVCVANENAADDLKRACELVHERLSRVDVCRWNPRLLALPVAQDSKRRFRMRPDGFGLVQFLDDILGYDRALFGELERRFCSIFPEMSSLKLVSEPAFRSPSDEIEEVTMLDQAEGKGLYFELKAGKQLVPAAQASDGVLLVLAYLALPYSPEPPRLILVEEPENGIHPKRLQEVLTILRELAAGPSPTQILLTTHSPYVVDLMQKEEVTLCTKSNDGSIRLTRMADSEAVLEQQSLFTLGEIWTAEGDAALAKESVVPSP